MRKVVIIPNPNKDPGLELADRLSAKLGELGYSVFIYHDYYSDIATDKFADGVQGAELAVVIGGDGSVIDASRLAVQLDVPLLGVNRGKMGYLSELEPDNIGVLDKLASGEYTVVEKMLLTAEKHNADDEIVATSRYALNDVVVSHEEYFGIADFTLENKMGDRIKFRADGLVAATPSGSTAYSLSAGGPIISHEMDSITVTPICPHSFFNRSVVYNPDEQLKVLNCGDNPLNVSLDGRFFERLDHGESAVIRMGDYRLKMITFTKNYMFSTLFKKIKVFENLV